MPSKQTSSYRHKQAVEALRRNHVEGSPCPWPGCGRPMFVKNPALNWDGKMPQADHVTPRSHGNTGPPTRLLCATCNNRRGPGRDYLAGQPHGDDDHDGAIDVGPHLIAVPW